ncbi:hypothetical protein DAPK24_053450 [Pichia kluyveri]|uniref:Thiol-specific monooxygenase n=1 Tax=Pichia kluyveri TaxID=36015 RepID=A0AAV5RCC0_PICKL|nr:hypothetical protein DAPK24_053450 [Pichia kluyveri]
MTVGNANKFNIKSIAVIGAGPSGIASLHELTRVTKSGESLFGLDDVSKYEKNGELAFDKVVAFERNSTVGGVWCKSAFAENNVDPNLPKIYQKTSDELDKLDFSNPTETYQKTPIDEELEKKLDSSSFEKPVSIPVNKKLETIINNQWRSSAAYNHLFTNVTNRYMIFSFNDIVGQELDDLNHKYEHLLNLQSARDVSDYLEKTAEKKDLKKYIRFNTNVERVKKLDNGKWEVIVSYESKNENGEKFINWYKEYFDAVIIGNGKTVPIIPKIKNLFKFAEVNKDKVIIKLAKSIQDTEFLRNAKKPLFIGSSVSSVDLIQYCYPRDLENPSIYISRRSPTSPHNWITFATYSKGIVNKPEIAEFLPETNSVKFIDGTVESDFDAIVICTGYHKYYPFLDQSFTEKHKEEAINFYKYTFSIGDPTLALVGNEYAGFFFNRVESQAAALAGVWNNTSFLPPKEEQIETNKNRPSLSSGLINPNFITPLIDLAPKGRPHPFVINKEKSDHVAHSAQGHFVIQDVFFKVRDGKLDPFKIV